MAIWSTIPDMLTWARAILERLRDEGTQRAIALANEEQEPKARSTFDLEPETKPSSIRQKALANPLRRISQITSHRFPVTDDTINKSTYGYGWARREISSSHLGWLSINGPQKLHIIGQLSRPRLALNHGEQVTGYLNTIYLFPESDSAVVVLTNAQSAGDCSDLVAQMYAQALFDLHSKIDFQERALHVSDDNLV